MADFVFMKKGVGYEKGDPQSTLSRGAPSGLGVVERASGIASEDMADFDQLSPMELRERPHRNQCVQSVPSPNRKSSTHELDEMRRQPGSSQPIDSRHHDTLARPCVRVRLANGADMNGGGSIHGIIENHSRQTTGK